MFRTFARKFLPNPLDRMLWRLKRKKGRKILLGWNRGLGDIALGLFAIVQRIKTIIPEAEITFITRENLKDGFSLLEGVQTILAPNWKRGEIAFIDQKLKAEFDLVIEKPSPTDWVYWQHGKVVPRLKWDPKNEELYQKFGLSENEIYIGVQVVAETNYGLWRNWPLEKWRELFDRLEKKGVKVLLFGFGSEPKFQNKNLIDLRGKTELFELLSIIKHRVYALVLPDSGISSMIYYLDEAFPIRLITLWADPNHGILKQNVPSPNPKLIHSPLIGKKRDLSTVSVNQVMDALFPVQKGAALILAGGQGTRLSFSGPKGLFSVEGKTLFQWLCEKIPKKMPVAIMTSPLNHEETVAYFRKKDHFGLEIDFFQQEMAPFLNEQKEPVDKQGPIGNGNVFRSFIKSGLKEAWAKKGINFMTVTNIDNPLSNPADPLLIASIQNQEIAVQCIEREAEDHSMGALVEKEGKWEVIEYISLPSDHTHKYAYSGQMAFNFSFFCQMGELELPLHWVKKKSGEDWIWKGEQFIFDVLPHAKKIKPICVNRETHYAPVKGLESIEKVKERLRKGK